MKKPFLLCMIFFGAGASNTFGIPTSNELTIRMTSILKQNYPEIMDEISQFLSNNNQSLDFENILTLLQALKDPRQVQANHYSQLFKNNHKEMPYDPYFLQEINNMYDYLCTECNKPFNDLNEKISKIIEYKFSLTYDLLFGLPFSPQFPNSHNPEDETNKFPTVFSTNYDPSIEIWCQRRNIPCIDGTNRTNNPEYSLMQNNAYFINQLVGGRNYGLPLIRLHGSIWNYRTKKNQIIKFNRATNKLLHSDLYSDFIKQRPLLILPGQEHLLSRGQWDILYQYYKQNLKGNCLFIGYSFRHDVLTNPIIDNLQNGNISKLIIFSPHPENAIQLINRDENIDSKKIIPIVGSFGTDYGLHELLLKWGEFEWNWSLGRIEEYFQAINDWKKTQNSLYN